jgi:alkylhydroperoxidase family enzyme
MQPRIDVQKVDPQAIEPMFRLEAYLERCGLEPGLLDLAKTRAALSWTEAVTLIHQGRAPDDVYEDVRRHFSEKELVDLMLAIVAINGWNRLAISLRQVPGTYHPAHAAQAQRQP